MTEQENVTDAQYGAETGQKRGRAAKMHNATVIMMHVMVVILGLLMGLMVLNA